VSFVYFADPVIPAQFAGLLTALVWMVAGFLGYAALWVYVDPVPAA
jgi:hypothetical protein